MKDEKYFRGSRKNPGFRRGGGGGGVTKSQYMGGLPKKGGLGQFADLREGGLARKRRVVFLRGG